MTGRLHWILLPSVTSPRVSLLWLAMFSRATKAAIVRSLFVVRLFACEGFFLSFIDEGYR